MSTSVSFKWRKKLFGGYQVVETFESPEFTAEEVIEFKTDEERLDYMARRVTDITNLKISRIFNNDL